MVTVKLGRDESQFWKMTPRQTSALIKEWSRMEEMQGQAQATRTAYAVVMMQHGKMPEWNSEEEKPVVVSNDSGFAGL